MICNTVIPSMSISTINSSSLVLNGQTHGVDLTVDRMQEAHLDPPAGAFAPSLHIWKCSIRSDLLVVCEAMLERCEGVLQCLYQWLRKLHVSANNNGGLGGSVVVNRSLILAHGIQSRPISRLFHCSVLSFFENRRMSTGKRWLLDR